MEARLISVSEIHANPENLRHSLGRLKELAGSIEAVGILQPIVVHKNGDGKYEIIAGHRRFAAALSLKLAEVPVVIRDDLKDAGKIEAMIVENFHREDLTPIEQAEGLFQLEQLGLNRTEIADKTGLSKRLVTERIKLMDLTSKAREEIHQGRLSIEAGLELAKEATNPDIIDQALEAITSGQYRNPDRAVEEVKAAAKHAEKMGVLLGKIEKLRELGQEVLEETGRRAYDEPDPTRGFKRVVAVDATGYYGDGIRLDPKAHAKEECVVWVFRPGSSGFYGQGPDLAQYCRKPNRHTFTGASELKVATAEKDAEIQASNRAANKAQREAAAAKTARYVGALAKKPPRALIAKLAIAGFVEKIYADHKKSAAQLLGLEPRDSQGTKDWTRPFDEYAAKDPERAVLALVLVDQEPLSGLKQWSRYLTEESLAEILDLIPEEVTE